MDPIILVTGGEYKRKGGENEMIHIDSSLCAGCGTCVDECPTGAMDLSDGKARIDLALCDACGACVSVCPNQALALTAEPVMEAVPESSLALVEPVTEIIRVETPRPVPWRYAILPAVGSALSWVGRELTPRLTPLALDVLEAALDRRLARSKASDGLSCTKNHDLGRGKQRRQRHRHRRAQK
jgi:ferredoxin